MRKTLFIFLAALGLISLNAQAETRHPEWAYDATIYELNVRQATPEGTFQAAEALLPTLKENGIDIIWIMPCQPIGKITRKGSLGSYYSIIDYCAINPEFGFGSALAMVISYCAWHSIGWAILHGILGWVYVLYYVIKY